MAKVTRLFAVLLLFGVLKDKGPGAASILVPSMLFCEQMVQIFTNMEPEPQFIEVGFECFQDQESADEFAKAYVDSKAEYLIGI